MLSRKRLWILCVGFLLTVNVKAQPAKAFQYVSGPPIEKLRKTSGQFIQLQPFGKTDTLLTWVEHLDPVGDSPDYRAAAKADLVIWCYPERYPSDKHVFSDAEGRVYLQKGEKSLWAVATK